MNPESSKKPVAVIILAAGKGTRMKSEGAKVLLPVAGKPMILYVVEAASRIAGRDVVVVIGNRADEVRSIVSEHAEVDFAVQHEQLGTGHAAMCALPFIGEHVEHVVVLCGDVPLITAETIDKLIKSHVCSNSAVTVLGARLDEPSGYGRLKQNSAGAVEKIVEELDATEEEKKINIINTGVYCLKRRFLGAALSQVGTSNAQNEMYLTDVVGIAAEKGQKIGLMLCSDKNEICGINTTEELERVEALISGNEKP